LSFLVGGTIDYKGKTRSIRSMSHLQYLDSLGATIKKHRPDMESQMIHISDKELPISEVAPEDFFAKHVKEIEDIGEPMNPCFFINSRTDPVNW